MLHWSQWNTVSADINLFGVDVILVAAELIVLLRRDLADGGAVVAIVREHDPRSPGVCHQHDDIVPAVAVGVFPRHRNSVARFDKAPGGFVVHPHAGGHIGVDALNLEVIRLPAALDIGFARQPALCGVAHDLGFFEQMRGIGSVDDALSGGLA
ncbi:MAG: hypothetical protein OXR62_12425 [Ahrensia sp.]|nr:hypothetical protein [Ahrensia sp.]